MTTINMRQLDGAFHFESSNEEGLSVRTDANPDIGGGGAAMRPMELVLSAVASCSSIDIVLLLKKQRQAITDLKVRVSGERAEEHPRVFTSISVHYELAGPQDARKVERAIRLSLEKLCSVSMMLTAGGVEIDWTYALQDAVAQ